MEMWEKILSIFAGIAGILIILAIISNFWPTYPQNKIEGSKEYVVNSIVEKVYKCFKENEGKKGSVICAHFTINSNEEIFSSDVLNSIDRSKIKVSMEEDLGLQAEVIIRYENQIIYIEKISYEGVST